MQTLNGLLLVNKPVDITSFDVLRHFKALLGRDVKMGHAGTLDPFATGLLIVCFGRATRLVPLLADVTKGYRVNAQFGRLTDSFDRTGREVEIQQVPLNLAELLPKAVELIGTAYKQVPPIYSALKHEGVPLYSLARDKKLSEDALSQLVTAKARWVIIYKLLIEKVSGAQVTFSCEVSKGAYIRTLADDLAQKIALRATTIELERTFIGPFLLEKAHLPEYYKSFESIENNLINIEKARLLLA